MQIKHIIILVMYGLVCFVGSLLFVQCESKKAQREIDKAHNEIEHVQGELDAIRAENTAMRDTLSRVHVAVEHVINDTQNIIEVTNERNEEINDLPSDWLQCELPDGVQDMFANYCHED